MKALIIIFLISTASYGQCILDPNHYHCSAKMQKQLFDMEERIGLLETRIEQLGKEPSNGTTCIDVTNCEGFDGVPQGGNLYTSWDIGHIIEYRFIKVGHLVNLNFLFTDVRSLIGQQTLTFEVPSNFIFKSLVNASGFLAIGGVEVVYKVSTNKGNNLLILHRLNANWGVFSAGTLQGNITFEIE